MTLSSDQLQEDSFISDLDSSRPESPDQRPAERSGKVLISELFKNVKPVKLRGTENAKTAEEEFMSGPEVLDLIEDSIDQRTESAKRKSTANIKSFLNGNRESKKAVVQLKDSEPIVIEADVRKPKTGLSAKDILIGKKGAEVVELLSSEDDEPLTTMTPKKKRRSHIIQEASLIVKLKYTPHKKKIEDLEKKMRSASSRSVSAKDIFRSFGKKEEKEKELLVTLEVRPEKLKEVMQENIDSLEQSDSRVPCAKSFLSVLSHKTVMLKHPVSKLKELEPPAISLEQMHVKYDEPHIEYHSIDLPKRSRTQLDQLNLGEIGMKHNRKKSDTNLYKLRATDSERFLLASQRIPTLSSDPRFLRFATLLAEEPKKDTWTTMFQPHSSSDILWSKKQLNAAHRWLQNSFKILKRSTKRYNFKKSKINEDEMNDFIVNEDDEDVTEDETYTPLLILSGPHGVGKTSAVYAMMEERSGYVYEINASQPRSRKDILANVRELSTTQLVHKQNGTAAESSFQEGVILFDDVDVLFESDRGFWSVVEDILKISRRPVILTCADPTEIPESIMECAESEQSLLELGKQDAHLLGQYLYLCALVNNCDVEYDVLMDIMKTNNSDLRRSLLSLEMVCKVKRPDHGLLKISLEPKLESRPDMDLGSMAIISDAYSLSDQIGTLSFSLINQEPYEDETLSSSRVIASDDILHGLLAFEFDMAQELLDVLPLARKYVNNSPSKSSIRRGEKEFTRRKVQNTKRLTRMTARQMFDSINSYFPESNNDSTIFDILSPSSYFTDVSPIIREFERFERSAAQENELIIKSDPEGRSSEQLMHDGLLIKRHFNGEYTSVLHNIPKDSGEWD
jgi:telomere length regulation protein